MSAPGPLTPPAGAGDTRCGFVAVVGSPNVGKSTLVNRLVGAKVAIVSPKVQTTRSRLLGIVIAGRTQVVLIDTPGIFAPQRRLDRAMVAAAWRGATDGDEILLVVDAKRGADTETLAIVRRLASLRRTAILVLNKIDLVEKPRLLVVAAQLAGQGTFSQTFMVCAETGDGVDDLLSCLAARLPPGPWLYPADQVSDLPNRLFAAEITREKIFLQLQQELPYASAVATESWTELRDGGVRIDQVIYVERPGHKAIVVGRNGSRIKRIGEAARTELERHLGRRVHLFLFVKVRQNWKDDPERYRDLGLDFDA
ncbi:MAG: GTPase Era [Rhodospirillales bacterium]